MTFSTVWAIGGGAKAGEDAGRLLANFATGGREGVLDPLACRVLALDTPGPGFKVMPGPFAVKARGVSFQSYLAAVTEADVTSGLAGTGSSGGRHDLVTLRIIDPYIGGTGDQVPADPVQGPYAIVEVLTGVPFGTKTYAELGLLRPAIAVARIEYPPSTATITQAMIKDLRGGAPDAAPGTAPISTPPAAAAQTFTDVKQATSQTFDLPFTQQSFKRWPDIASWQVPVPEWATNFSFEIQVVNAKQIPTPGQSVPLAHLWGETRLVIGTEATAPIVFDQDYIGGGSPTSVMIPCGGTYGIGANSRGKMTTIELQARSYNDPNTKGTVRFTKGAYVKMWIHFKSVPTLA